MLVYRKRNTERVFFERPEGMSALLHALLIERGFGSAAEAEAFLAPGASLLHDPMLLPGMRGAASRVRAAVADGERICVYGDYDVDGVTASAMMQLHLSSLGANARVYLPDRHLEGYGLNDAAIRSLAQEAKLLITVDCGITAAQQVRLARSLGMDVIVTDHHRPGAELPDCTVVDPVLGGYPCEYLSGAGVAFKLIEALSGREAAMEYVDLAALSTVADVVPLLGENRAIVHLGLERMNERPRVGLRALRRAAGLEERTLTAGHLGFQIGPRLNAGGRLGSARRALELLVCENEARADALAAELEAENTERRRVEAEMLAQAEDMLHGFDFPAHRAIVLARAGWNTGVVGLAASRLVEKYRYPTILLSEEEGVLKGSCRSIPGVDIFAALTATGEHLLRFGGHRQAAGLTLSRENLAPFVEALEAHLRAQAPAEAYIPALEYDLDVSLGDLDAFSVASLEAMQPTGLGNPAPVLRARALVEDVRRVGRDGAHLRMRARDGSGACTGVMFSAGERACEAAGACDLLFFPKLNLWQGRTSVEMEVRAMEPVDARELLRSARERQDELVIRFLTEMLYNSEETADAEAADPAALRALFAQWPQGALAVAWDAEQAEFLLDAMEAEGEARFDLCVGGYPGDPRAFNAVCVLPVGERSPHARRIQAASVRGAPPCAWLAQLPDVDGMRNAYRALRDIFRRPARWEGFSGLSRLTAAESGLSPIGAAAALLALADMRLIELDARSGARPLPMRKCDPLESRVARRVLCLREEGKEGGARQ